MKKLALVAATMMVSTCVALYFVINQPANRHDEWYNEIWG